VTIAPDVAAVGMLDWEAGMRMRDVGRRAAEEALASDPALAVLAG